MGFDRFYVYINQNIQGVQSGPLYGQIMLQSPCKCPSFVCQVGQPVPHLLLLQCIFFHYLSLYCPSLNYPFGLLWLCHTRYLNTVSWQMRQRALIAHGRLVALLPQPSTAPPVCSHPRRVPHLSNIVQPT